MHDRTTEEHAKYIVDMTGERERWKSIKSIWFRLIGFFYMFSGWLWPRIILPIKTASPNWAIKQRAIKLAQLITLFWTILNSIDCSTLSHTKPNANINKTNKRNNLFLWWTNSFFIIYLRDLSIIFIENIDLGLIMKNDCYFNSKFIIIHIYDLLYHILYT